MRPTNEILYRSGKELLSCFIPNFSGGACMFDRGYDRSKGNDDMLVDS